MKIKNFKTLDFVLFGMYIPVLLTSLQHSTFQVFLVLFTMVHFFPLTYLLRKHKYLTTLDDFGIKPTKNMEILVDELFIAPFLRLVIFLKKKKVIVSLFRILILSISLFLVSYYLIPKILQFPSLDLIYLQCK